MQRVKHPQKLGDRLGDPDTHDVSFLVLFEGWATDVERLHRSLRAHLPDRDWEFVVVDNPTDDEASERIAALERVVHVPLAEHVGFGGGRNLALRLATGRICVVVDTSVELTGDALAPIEAHLADEHIGLVGRWGVVTPNGFDFDEAEGPDVDGVEAYFMAGRRAVFAEAGLFDPKFRWYRNGDVDFTFRVRAAGYRTIVDPSLPLARHTHRLWEATPEAEREQLSRKNFWRFRDHWGEREDLFLSMR